MSSEQVTSKQAGALVHLCIMAHRFERLAYGQLATVRASETDEAIGHLGDPGFRIGDVIDPTHEGIADIDFHKFVQPQ